LVLPPSFLHHFDPSSVVRLLKKIRAAMASGALLAILETVPNEGRISPPSPAASSLLMLASTPAGDAYTFPELDAILREAGFSENELNAPTRPTCAAKLWHDRNVSRRRPEPSPDL
jgi:O-methyltransferase domain